METRKNLYSLALERPSKGFLGGASGLPCSFSVSLWLLCGLLCFTQPAAAEGDVTNAFAGYRIAVVDMADVLKRSPQSAAESQLLEDKFAERERALVGEQEALTQAEDTFNREVPLLSPSERVARESQLRAQQRKLKRNREDLREEVRIAKDSALNRLQANVSQAIKAIREQESIDIIFRETDYVAASERVDITGQVLTYLQQRFEEEMASKRPAVGDQAN